MHDQSFRSMSRLNRRAALSGVGAAAAALSVAHLTRTSAQQATPRAQAIPSAVDAERAELIRVTERERLRALVEADMDVAEQLHADDFQLINPVGDTLSKEEYLGGIASGDIDYLVFEPTTPIAVRLHGDTAIIRYQSRIHIVVGGEDITTKGWHTDFYERRDGRWQAVWSQMTEIA